MIKCIESDIVCVNETHLKGDAIFEKEGYTFYGYNRRAQKGSG